MAYFDDFHIINGSTVRQHRMTTIAEVPYHALKLVLSGRFQFGRRGGIIHELSAPVLFWQRPGIVYERGPVDAWEVALVRFTGARASELLNQGFDAVSDREYCQLRDPEPIRRLMEQMGLLKRRPLAFESAQGQILAEQILLATLQDQAMQGNLQRGPYALELATLLKRIEQSPGAPIDFHAEARNIGLSYSHFRKLFREQTGHPPNNYLISCRLQALATDLLFTNKSIKQLAVELGYHEVGYLSRLFRNRYGMGPRAYRTVHRRV